MISLLKRSVNERELFLAKTVGKAGKKHILHFGGVRTSGYQCLCIISKILVMFSSSMTSS